MSPINVLLSGLPSSPSLCLRIGDHTKPLLQAELTAAVTAITGLPSPSFYLRRHGALLHSCNPLAPISTPGDDTLFVNIALRRALPGGKGGFGATLKGASASKKTTNFDACRDLNGRRLRDVKDEQAMRRYLREQARQPSSPRPRKRQRPEPEEVAMNALNLEQLDGEINDVNRHVEDAVAAGFRTLNQQKRQRVAEDGATQVAPIVWMTDEEQSSSDSDAVPSDSPGSSASALPQVPTPSC